MIRKLVNLVVVTLLWAADARAQSVFATRGLGVPIPAADARGLALGGITTGLLGQNPSLDNVAEAGGVVRRGISASFQPSTRSFDVGGATERLSATRFPLIQAVYPAAPRVVVSLGYGAFLDQSWGLTNESTELLGGNIVRTRDETTSTGGVAQMKLGVSYRVTPGFWLGLGGGLYTGSVQRDQVRSFPDTAQSSLSGFTSRTRWSYTAPLATAGARVDLGTFARVGASVTWAGELDAKAVDDVSETRAFSLPLQAQAGISALLAPGLVASANAHYAGWETTTEDFRAATPGIPGSQGTIARNTLSVGGGVEYSFRTTQTRSIPIRLGYRTSQFPFRLAGDDDVDESAFSFGLGYRLAGDDETPLATVDLGVERGDRTGGPSASAAGETFVRATISVSLFGR